MTVNHALNTQPLRNSNARLFVVAVTFLIGVQITRPARATAQTWTGAVNSNWSEPENWNPVGTPQNGATLLFRAGDKNRNMVNDLTNLRVRLLSFGFAGNGFNYTLSGNPLRLNGSAGSVVMAAIPDGSATYTIHCPLVLTGSGGTFRANNVSPAIALENTTTLRLTGPITLEGGDWVFETLESNINGGGYRAEIHIASRIEGHGSIITRNLTFSGTHLSFIEFNGSETNTFAGNLFVGTPDSSQTDAYVKFNRATGVPVVGSDARLIVSARCLVELASSEQIDDAATVELRGGVFRLEEYHETIRDLILIDDNESGSSRSPTANTGTGRLALTGRLMSFRNSTNDSSQPAILGNDLHLNGFIPIEVSGSPSLGLTILANISGNGFVKTGDATLLLRGANTFSGDVVIENGAIEALTPRAFGVTDLPSGVHLNGGTVTIQEAFIGAEPLFVNSPSSLLTAIGPSGWAGPVILNETLIVAALDPMFGDALFDLSGPVTGPGGLDIPSPLFGVGQMRLSGNSPNTFAGPLTVRCQRLELGKASGVPAFGGPLIVGGTGLGTEVRWLQNFQKINADVTIHPSGFVNLDGHADDFGPLTFHGGRIATGGGELNLYGLVTVHSASDAAVIDGRLGLPSGLPEFRVHDGPALPDLLVNATLVGPGHWRKTGPGQMWLSSSNSYTGGSFVIEGTLTVRHAHALGAPASSTSVNDGATLHVNTLGGTLPEPLLLQGAGVANLGALNLEGFAIFSPPLPSIQPAIDLTAGATIRTHANSLLTVDGFISGTGPLTKTGPGTLLLANDNANTYAGPTLVVAGTVELAKPNNAVAVPGDLVVGPAPFGSSALVRWSQDNGLGAGAVVRVGSLSPSGSHAGSSISGHIGLPANNFVTFNVAPYAIFPPFDTAPELEVPALISVNGFESGILEPAGFSKVSLGWMRLSANNAYRGEAFISGGTLQVDGSQAQSSVRIGPGARLAGFGILGPVRFQGGSGVMAPGASPGILTTGDLNPGASGNGVLELEFNGSTAGSGYDQVRVQGEVTLTGTSLNGRLNYGSVIGDQFVIIDNDGSDSVIGTFSGLPQDASLYIGDEEFTISYTGGTGNDVVLTRVFTRPRPGLMIESAGPDLVRLSWPTNYAEQYRLEFAMGAPGGWASASPAPQIAGANYVVTNLTSGIEHLSAVTPLAWYRLGEEDPGAEPGLAVVNPMVGSAGGDSIVPFGSPRYTAVVSADAATQVVSALAVEFNGNGQYANADGANGANVFTALDNFGIEAWVRPDTADGAYRFVAYNGDTAGNGWGIVWQDGAFQGWYGNAVLFGAGVVAPGTWTHVALVRDDGFSTLYVNGVPSGSPTGIAPRSATTGFALAARPESPGAELFQGSIDEVRVFTFSPGKFRTEELLLNHASSQTAVPPVRFYRLVKP